MQQTCSNCRYPLQPGAVVCTNCGTPVSAAGGGSYDPTVRAGAPPSTGYGQPSYGAPSAPDPYSAQYSGPPGGGYGAPPSGPNPYGAPPASPYGAPPAQPGFGGPPPYGAPVGFPGQMPPKKSNKGLFIGLGIVGGIVVIAIIGCIVLTNFVINKGKQVVNSVEATATALAGENGKHITDVHIGTGFDQNSNQITGESSTLSTGDAWVAFTANNQDPNATVELKLYNDGTETAHAGPDKLDVGTEVYPYQLTLRNTGSDKIEIYYNGHLEATISFTVTS